jgi:hypothetical protein
MRFERQGLTGQDAKRVSAQKQNKILAHGSNDMYERDLSEYDSDRRSPTPESFYLSAPATKPSPKYPAWNFRWRGAETGEGVIELNSDEKAYTVTFEEPMGTKFTGIFGSNFFDDCQFTGIKLGLGRDSSVNISEEWADRNERAYNYACHHRWGG